MSAFLPLILTWILGVVMSFVVAKELRLTERIGLGFLIGIGFQTWMMFIFYLTSLRFTVLSFVFQWIVLMFIGLVVLFFLRRLGLLFAFFSELIHPKNYLLDKTFLGILILILGVSLIISLYWPVIGWDALALFDFRAKTFLVTGGMEDGIARGFFFGYPLLTSLGHTWVYMFGGNPHVMYWLLYVSFLLVVYSFLSKKILPLTAKVLTVILAISPELFQQSFFDYAVLPYLVYMVLATLYLVEWIKSSTNFYLILSMLLLGFATWSRIKEPFWLALVFFSIVGFLLKVIELRKLSKKMLSYLLLWVVSIGIFFTIQQSWRLFELFNQGQSSASLHVEQIASDIGSFNFYNIFDVVSSTYLITISTWQPALGILIIFLIFEYRSIYKYKYLLAITLMEILLLFAGTFDYSLYLKEWKLTLTSQRMLSGFIYIQILILIACFADNTVKNLSKEWSRSIK